MSGAGDRQPSDAGAAARHRLLEASALAGAAAAFLWRLPMLHRSHFGADELEHLQAAWSVARGLLIYRDYFQHHTPWFYLLLAQPLRAFEVATDPAQAEAFLFLGRYLALVLAAAALALTWLLARLWRGRTVAAVAVLLLSVCVMFVEKTLEIRPDGLALVFWLASLCATLAGFRAPPRARRATLLLAAGGAALGGAVLSTQKLLFAAPGMAAAGLMYLLARPAGTPAGPRLRGCLVQLAGFAAPSLATLAYFALRGGAREFIDACFLQTAAWKYRFSPLEYGSRLVADNPELALLALAGAGWAAAGALGRERLERGDYLPLLALLSLSAGLFVIPVPYPQYFLHLLPLAALFAAAAFVDLIPAAAPVLAAVWRPPLRVPLAAAVVLLAVALALVRPAPVAKLVAAVAAGRDLPLIAAWTVLLVVGALLLRRPGRRDLGATLIAAALVLYPATQLRHVGSASNREQLADMRYILETTRPEDTVLDGWPKLAPFRPPAFFHHMPHREVRELLGEARREQYARRLETGQVSPTLVVLDDDVRAFSPRIAEFVERHYDPMPVDGLWRRRTNDER